MTDPTDVTRYDRTDDELLVFWLFALFVRGKNAIVQAAKLHQFIIQSGGLSAIICASDEEIVCNLRAVKSGQYNSLSTAIYETANKIWQNDVFLREASITELESICGVGPKTSRFFVLHTRPGARVAALDTHILQFLQLHTDAVIPRQTPASAGTYARLEQDFLLLADFEGVAPADMDLAIWRASREGDPLAWRNYYNSSA